MPLSSLANRIERLRWSVEEAADTPPDRRFRKGGRHKKDGARPCPELREHPDGRAYCRWREGQRRRVRYFEEWGTAEARAAYSVFAASWRDTGVPPVAAGRAATVTALIRRFAG